MESAFGGEAIEPAENALVNTSWRVDRHNTYTIYNDVVLDDAEIDNEDGNHGGNCDVEMGERIIVTLMSQLICNMFLQ